MPGELVVSDHGVVANNIQVDLLHSRSMVRSLPLGRCMVWWAVLEEESKSTVAFSSPLNQNVLVGPALVTFMVWNSGRLVSNFSSLPGVCQADTISSSWPTSPW